MQVNPNIDQLHVKNSSIPLTLASLPLKPLQYAEPTSLRNDRVSRSILTFVKGPDIIHHLKAGKKRVSHAVSIHILRKDYSNFIIYTVCFTFLFLKIQFDASFPQAVVSLQFNLMLIWPSRLGLLSIFLPLFLVVNNYHLLSYVQLLTDFKLCATTAINTQQHATQGLQTDAPCNIQQCWKLLDNNVASVCKELQVTICLIINLVNYFVYLAQVLYGWNLTVVKTTFSSILIRWANLTSLLNRKVGQYVVFLNRRNNSVAFHQVVNGDQLTTEIKGLTHLTNYTVEVVGIDTLRKPYKTPSEAIMTANRKSKYFKQGTVSEETPRFFYIHGYIW